MKNSKPSILINLLCLFLLSQQTFGLTNSGFPFHTCSTDSYTPDSPFASNLKQTLDPLSSSASSSGYATSSAGNDITNDVNGLALCRGEVSPTDCKTCIDTASGEIRKRCPSSKGGSIWYDLCFVKYSNKNFLGIIDNGAWAYMWSKGEAEIKKARFSEQVKTFLNNLVAKVELLPTFFVSNVEGIEDSQTLYGLVQCTRDLAAPDCKKCLVNAIAELPICCDARIGARVIGGSCNFRYEIYPFLPSQK